MKELKKRNCGERGVINAVQADRIRTWKVHVEVMSETNIYNFSQMYEISTRGFEDIVR